MAGDAKIARGTIYQFLKGNRVRSDKAQAIASYLSLNLADIVVLPFTALTNEEQSTSKFRQSLEQALWDSYQVMDWFRVPMLMQPQPLSTIYVEPDCYRQMPSARKSSSLPSIRLTHSTTHLNDRLEQIEPERQTISIAPGSHTLIVGGSCSGKTALLKSLMRQALQVSEQPTAFPFLIRLDDFESWDFEMEIDQIIGEQVANLQQQSTEAVWQQVVGLLQSGSVLLLLDSMEQVKNCTKLLWKIQTFTRSYPKTTIVVTSRQPHRFSLESFNVIEIARFSLSQIQQFAHLWFRDRGSFQHCQPFLDQLACAPVVQEFCKVPAVLATLATLFEENPEIEFHKQTEEWAEFVLNYLTRDWDRSHQIFHPISPLFSNSHSLAVWSLVAKQMSPEQLLFSVNDVKFSLIEYCRSLRQMTPDKLAQIDCSKFVEQTQLYTGLIEEQFHGLYSFRFSGFRQLLAQRSEL